MNKYGFLPSCVDESETLIIGDPNEAWVLEIYSVGPGWDPEEIGVYIDSKLKDGTPLVELSQLTSTDEGTVSLTFKSEVQVASANLHFTTEKGLRSKRKWQSLPATVDGKTISAKGLPKEANTWLMTVTDERGLLVTSEVGFTASEQ
jgi:hypothetical protein